MTISLKEPLSKRRAPVRGAARVRQEPRIAASKIVEAFEEMKGAQDYATPTVIDPDLARRAVLVCQWIADAKDRAQLAIARAAAHAVAEEAESIQAEQFSFEVL